MNEAQYFEQFSGEEGPKVALPLFLPQIHFDSDEFHVELVTVVDPEDHQTSVVRYALVDDQGVVWLDGKPFDLVINMTTANRHLLCKTEVEAWRHLPE